MRNNFSSKIVPFFAVKVQKNIYFRAGQATVDTMVHAHCMLDT